MYSTASPSAETTVMEFKIFVYKWKFETSVFTKTSRASYYFNQKTLNAA